MSFLTGRGRFVRKDLARKAVAAERRHDGCFKGGRLCLGGKSGGRKTEIHSDGFVLATTSRKTCLGERKTRANLGLTNSLLSCVQLLSNFLTIRERLSYQFSYQILNVQHPIIKSGNNCRKLLYNLYNKDHYISCSYTLL